MLYRAVLLTLGAHARSEVYCSCCVCMCVCVCVCMCVCDHSLLSKYSRYPDTEYRLLSAWYEIQTTIWVRNKDHNLGMKLGALSGYEIRSVIWVRNKDHYLGTK